MSKKRIAIFGVKYFPAKGGTSRVVEHLLSELHEQYTFTIYCYRHPKANEHISGVKTVQFKEIPIKGLGVFIYYLRCCMHIMFSKQYDLIHLHKTDAAFFLPLLCLKYKVIATAHALPQLNKKWSVFGRFYFRITEWIFINSRASLTAIAKTQCQYFQKKYNRVVQFIPNGIHPVKIIEPGLVDGLLDQFDIQNDYLLFAARRVIPLKGCHTLIRALQKIQFKGTLLVAGDTDQLPAYTDTLKKLAEGLDVKFIGYVEGIDKLNALLQRARYFIFPSELEGMSMMLLEAGSIGTPMICSDIPQNKAVLSEEEVLFFQSKNIDDLAQKLNWAFDNEQHMQSLADKTKQRIEAEYLFSKIARQYAELYDTLLFPKTMIPKARQI